LELLLLLVIKAIPVKVFGKWGSAVAEAMAGQGGEENHFSKRFLPHKTVLQQPPVFTDSFSASFLSCLSTRIGNLVLFKSAVHRDRTASCSTLIRQILDIFCFFCRKKLFF